MLTHTQRVIALLTGVFIGLALGLVAGLFLIAPARADVPDPVVIEEDDPGWSCVDDGNRICGPNNPQGALPGCYDEGGVLVAVWPCHVVVNPQTGEGDVYEGLA